MKKLLTMILALVLCATLLPLSALAAPGDAILARRGVDFEDYVESAAAIDDTLYLLGNQALYTWKPGEADLTAYPWNEESLNRGGKGEYDEKTDTYTYDYVTNITFFSDGGKLYAIRSTNRNEGNNSTLEDISLYEIVIENGEAGYAKGIELDWEPMMEYYDESAYAKRCEGATAVDGVLYGLFYGDSGDYEVYAVPLDGGYSKLIEEIETPFSIAAYTDGKILFEQFSYDDNTRVAFAAYDPASETVEQLCELEVPEYNTKNGVAYSPETDLLYYADGGRIMSLNLETLEEIEVNDLPVSVYSGAGAIMLKGGLYVMSSYEAVAVRNTDPSKRAEYKLNIYNGAYADAIQQAYFGFSNIRGDVSIVMSNEYRESAQIVEAMMNRSADTDIYVLNMSDTAFDAVYSRGYMSEMTSEKIDAFVGEMYPAIAEAMKMNGNVVCLPVSCYAYTIGLNTEAMKAANIQPEELPGSWVEFLDFLNTLPERLADTEVSVFYNWSTQDDMKSQLLNLIITDYQKYLNYTGKEQGYNTDVLRSVLNKLDEVDFAALGLPEEIDYENEDMMWSFSEGSVLVETGIGCTIGEYYGGYTPMLLSMTPETPKLLQLSMSAAFINPFSENKEIATAFLETLTESLPDSVLYNLQDGMNEPKRSSYYEENRQQAQESLDELKASLEKASAEEKQMIEESIKSQEEYLAYLEENYWEISPKAIEWYRQNDEFLSVESYNPFYSDNSGEIWTLMQQYTEGSLDLDQFLRAVDQKVQMMVLEGN